MKYFTASLLIAGAAAQGSAGTAAQSAINALITATNQLTTDVNAYTGGDGATLKSDAAALVKMITDDDASVKAAGPIAQSDALGLAGPVQSLGTAAKAAVDALVAKKALFVSNGQGAAVYEALKNQADASNTFSADLLAEVPEGLRGIAGNLAAPISSALASGVSAFADAATASGSGSSATASGGVSVTSAAASTPAVTTPAATTPAVVTMSGNGTAPTAVPTIVMGGANHNVIASGAVGLLALLAAIGL